MLRSRRSLKPAANAPSLLFILKKTVPEAASSERVSHSDLANAIRVLAMDAVEQAKSGHPGLPMGAADIATVLFTRHLKYDAADPIWPDRDRFVLSAGHGSMLLYSLLYLTGYRGDDDRGDQALPPAGVEDAGAPRELHDAGRRDDDRSARPGARHRGRHGARRAHAQRRSSATISSITAPTCSPPTAT